ncbi:Hypothetical predicted protein [Mytilus galloprovincialis]|uniref:Uncharacterized protein n=1 Tax=Mytilus galloprovincialis TaxID=29158 RepID=A0A8B6D9Z3_MYTGA|nr:Hypothetical predicted protein [Mytilus galloprovincialis]
MDKFGSHSRKRMPIWRMLQDLDMNDNRITSLGLPRDSSDAVTKRWVNLQLKDGVKAIDELEVELGATQKSIEAEKKRLDRIEKEMVKCLPTAGGEMNGDIDMRGHAIRNLSKGTEAGEPVTKGWIFERRYPRPSLHQGSLSPLFGRRGAGDEATTQAWRYRTLLLRGGERRARSPRARSHPQKPHGLRRLDAEQAEQVRRLLRARSS